MRALLTADQHLGKSQDLGRTPGERLAEQELNWRHTLELAREHDVDAVLHGGDLFDGRRPGPEIMLAAERPLVEHRTLTGGENVIVCAGNHDVPSQDGECGLDVLAEAGLIELARVPHTWHFPDVAVCALPWTPVARLLAARDGVPREQVFEEAAELVVQAARDLRAQCYGSPAILLSHWAVTQTVLPTGLDVGMLAGVVLPMDDLQAIGFDAIVMGHIHAAQQVGDFVYTGSPMPLDFGEGGQEHGCWLWDSETGFEFLPLPSRGFVTLNTLAALPDIKGAFVKVRQVLTEEEAAGFDMAVVRADLEARGAYSVSFEVTVERARRDRGTVLAEDLSPAQQLAAYLDSLRVNGSVGAAMMETAEGYI